MRHIEQVTANNPLYAATAGEIDGAPSSGESTWAQVVWPELRRKIVALLECVQVATTSSSNNSNNEGDSSSSGGDSGSCFAFLGFVSSFLCPLPPPLLE